MNKAYELARGEIGTYEWAGSDHNPKVLKYFEESGHSWVTDDETAWCAAFVGSMLKRAGIAGTGELTARSYLKWGKPVHISEAREGDIVIFKRGSSSWQGHVGFLVKVNAKTITVLGGNQSNQVNERDYSRAKLLGVRRAPGMDKRKVVAPAAGVAILAALTAWGQSIVDWVRSLIGG